MFRRVMYLFVQLLQGRFRFFNNAQFRNRKGAFNRKRPFARFCRM
jgi:hypothetical protein